MAVVLAGAERRQRVSGRSGPGAVSREGDDRAGEFGDVHAAVVAGASVRTRRDPLEEGPARVGGELPRLIFPWAIASSYARRGGRSVGVETRPAAKANLCSIASPSNQWLYFCHPLRIWPARYERGHLSATLAPRRERAIRRRWFPKPASKTEVVRRQVHCLLSAWQVRRRRQLA